MDYECGVLIAVLSCWLSWTLILVETPLAMAKDGTFPKFFKNKNKNDIPYVSTYITSMLMQIGIIAVFFADNAWRLLLSITGVMVLPAYLVSAIYLLKISIKKEYSKRLPIKRSTMLFTSIFACIFALWLIYSAGLKYLMMAIIFFILGIPVFLFSKK